MAKASKSTALRHAANPMRGISQYVANMVGIPIHQFRPGTFMGQTPPPLTPQQIDQSRLNQQEHQQRMAQHGVMGPESMPGMGPMQPHWEARARQMGASPVVRPPQQPQQNNILIELARGMIGVWSKAVNNAVAAEKQRKDAERQEQERVAAQAIQDRKRKIVEQQFELMAALYRAGLFGVPPTQMTENPRRMTPEERRRAELRDLRARKDRTAQAATPEQRRRMGLQTQQELRQAAEKRQAAETERQNKLKAARNDIADGTNEIRNALREIENIARQYGAGTISQNAFETRIADQRNKIVQAQSKRHEAEVVINRLGGRTTFHGPIRGEQIDELIRKGKRAGLAEKLRNQPPSPRSIEHRAKLGSGSRTERMADWYRRQLARRDLTPEQRQKYHWQLISLMGAGSSAPPPNEGPKSPPQGDPRTRPDLAVGKSERELDYLLSKGFINEEQHRRGLDHLESNGFFVRQRQRPAYQPAPAPPPAPAAQPAPVPQQAAPQQAQPFEHQEMNDI